MVDICTLPRKRVPGRLYICWLALPVLVRVEYPLQMSRLFDALKRGKSSPDEHGEARNDASSVKSSGGESAESISSLDSTLAGASGAPVPKRRRPHVSRLGVPEWYADDPPPLQAMPGTALPPELPAFSCAHSTVMHATAAGKQPWLGLVLYNHGPASHSMPVYHNGDKIAGEVRIMLNKPKNLSSIDVWFVFKLDSVINMFKKPTLTMTANLWNRKKGDPRTMGAGGSHFKEKFPQGTFVLPFEFPALPTDTVVKHPDEERRKIKGRLPLPPTYTLNIKTYFSGSIKYTIGVNVARDGFGAVNEEFNMDVQYVPLARPLSAPKTPFPFLPAREEWPLAPEVVGSWRLNPFSGSGRLGEELVEVEGILGIQEPVVYTAGQTIEFSLMLWSTHPLALEALAQPGAISVNYSQSDLFANDALNPKKASRKYRKLERLATGRVWLTEEGKPAEYDPVPVCALVELPEPRRRPKSPQAGPSSHVQQRRLVDFDDDADAATLAGDASDAKLSKKGDDEDEDENKSSPSPTPSFEGFNQGLRDPERVVRLDGEVRVPSCSHPSFRFSSMAREYVLHLLITHPQYAHVSPTDATGIVAEAPVWYVVNRFGQTSGSQNEVNRAVLSVKGPVVPVGEDAVRLPASVGHVTTQQRPTSRPQRVEAF
ncbi:hypothetical protein MVEN_01362700 [Mycena venus]|uniref:Arrestin-like N-terminal domain-containing protein n=1 Tax=Mycena venus TaxID=2733690 RepID=A0A8H6XY70_9AGAR|nr:hypothetical protein MVEN_01362700 [Mycena venus]